MKARLKPIAEQVIVVTGATSGHGLCTAQKAAAAGARVMLAARDEQALQQVCDDIRRSGGAAEYVVADVGRQDDVDRLARETVERFGGFDSWINNAGIGVYADVTELTLEDHRQVFETNYWGVVHGSMAALHHLKDKQGGGAIINVGSINGDMGGPVLASYNASKHAVKGFTDSLRIEALAKGWPLSVTLIKPSAIATPFTRSARNLTGFAARLPPPIYDPQLVADAILDAARRPRRAITVGGGGKVQVLGATMFPTLFDQLAAGMADRLVDRDRPVGRVEGNLYAPMGGEGGDVDGDQHGRGFSIFTSVSRHRRAAALGVAAAAGLSAALYALRRRILPV